jgi:4-amino-4-deoxy-L-arabinose transferase-like glycosyltransferase
MGSPAQHAPSGASRRPDTGPAFGWARRRRRHDAGAGELLSSARRGITLRAVASVSSSSRLAIGAPSLLFDRLAVAVLVAVAGVALMTFRDYGLGWDDYAHSEYGELLVALYGSRFTDRRALSFVNLYMYGGGFDLLAALAAKVAPFTLFETRRLTGALVGLIGLIATWRTGRRIGGPLAGFAALVLLATCPLYIGHMFLNAKDAPFAVAMAILLLAQVRVLEAYPRITPATGALTGTGFGLSIGSRIMGGFGGVDLAGALALLAVLEARLDGLRPAAARLGRCLLSLLPALVLAYALMALVWPWSVIDPLNPWRAVAYFSHFFEQPWRELFAGELVLVPDMPRSYVPTLFALQLPELLLGLALAGTVGTLIAACRRNLAPNRRAILVLVVLAATLPIVVTVLARPAMYNGIRHFVFVLPPLAVLGGLAAAWLIAGLRQHSRWLAAAACIALLAGSALPIRDMVRLHPYEYTYYNRLAGGIAGAHGRFMLDYWGLSFKQASQGLARELAERHESKPAERRWKLAVCGPHRSPQVELGPDFETSWDPQGADFALMLGEFYCRTFDAPILVEIVREGVVYARVYDIRGRSFATLLTTPTP